MKVTNIFKLQYSRKCDNDSVYLCMYREIIDIIKRE